MRAMSDKPVSNQREAKYSREAKSSREERLATKLRENLLRRKEQARAAAAQDLPKPPPSG
jgi:hypothetical protein